MPIGCLQQDKCLQKEEKKGLERIEGWGGREREGGGEREGEDGGGREGGGEREGEVGGREWREREPVSRGASRCQQGERGGRSGRMEAGHCHFSQQAGQ